MNRKNDNSGLYAALLVVAFILVVGLVKEAATPKCISAGCDNDQAKESSYCYLHEKLSNSHWSSNKSSSYSGGSSSYNSSSSTKSSGSSSSSGYTSSSKKSSYSSSYNSYDDGYEDVYENDDYDWDRYYSDDDYAAGVDDAMDELDW